jgi:hypothetical protein
MELEDMLESVRNNRIEFATMRPQGSNFTTLERKVVVTGPPELVNLTEVGDLRVLDELIKFLKEPDRAWAAEVLLSVMTQREEKMVDSFSASPDDWWHSVGKTAYDRWAEWLRETRESLVWDSETKAFIERK